MNQRERVKERDLKRERNRKKEERKKERKKEKEEREKKEEDNEGDRKRKLKRKRKKSTKLIYLFRAGQNFVLNRVFTTDAFCAYERALLRQIDAHASTRDMAQVTLRQY